SQQAHGVTCGCMARGWRGLERNPKRMVNGQWPMVKEGPAGSSCLLLCAPLRALRQEVLLHRRWQWRSGAWHADGADGTGTPREWSTVNGQWSMRCPRAPSVFSSAYLCALCGRWFSYTDDGNGAAGCGTLTARIGAELQENGQRSMANG